MVKGFTLLNNASCSISLRSNLNFTIRSVFFTSHIVTNNKLVSFKPRQHFTYSNFPVVSEKLNGCV